MTRLTSSVLQMNGGPGSGDWGHAGRPGEVGGSAGKGKGGSAKASGKSESDSKGKSSGLVRDISTYENKCKADASNIESFKKKSIEERQHSSSGDGFDAVLKEAGEKVHDRLQSQGDAEDGEVKYEYSQAYGYLHKETLLQKESKNGWAETGTVNELWTGKGFSTQSARIKAQKESSYEEKDKLGKTNRATVSVERYIDANLSTKHIEVVRDNIGSSALTTGRDSFKYEPGDRSLTSTMRIGKGEYMRVIFNQDGKVYKNNTRNSNKFWEETYKVIKEAS